MTHTSAETVGMAPGELVHVGERKAKKVGITLVDYDAKNYTEKRLRRVEESFPFRDDPKMTWINIDGIHDTKVIEKIGKHFMVHPLILEDILNTEQRPKIEEFQDHVFIVLKMMMYDMRDKEIKPEQVSIIFGKNFVISFLEKEGDIFETVKARLKVGKGKIRELGADYLAYTLMDVIVDHYFVTLEKMGEQIEELEDELLENPDQNALREIHSLRRQVIVLRRSIWPLREVVSSFQRLESKLVKRTVGIYLRDIYDHIIHIVDTIESYRDSLSGMLDIYLSSINNRMNSVMKVLTVITTIFIPLSFITGVYGMNFEYMPELQWEYGYFVVWGVILVTVITMLALFIRKKWL